MIYILTSKNNAAIKKALGLKGKETWVEFLPVLKDPPANKFEATDMVYLDASAYFPAELKKAIALQKKGRNFWGIIDPKGSAEDPAAFFFDGAADYIGPGLYKKGMNKKRFDQAFSWVSSRGTGGDDSKSTDGAAAAEKKQGAKFPSAKFEGWRSIRPGTSGQFLFLYVALKGKTNIRAIVGEAAFVTVRNRLRDVLVRGFAEADGLLWMETEDSSLFLIPPKVDKGKLAVEASLKLILSGRLIGIEKLDVTTPVEFTMALHFGGTIFQAPGKTGAVISETVNYIFHLGGKKAESGRLTISGAVPDEVIPEGLKDFFSQAGVFEGIPIIQSKRFTHE
ncbi:MAG: hypothetical protein FWH19_05985 [Treponema sp.]|nr:hypothetical protein [Treponema sp.]